MFDNVCKFLAENFKDDFASWLLGSEIKLTELKPTELSLEPIRADSLILLQSESLILHLEFQTEADSKIPFRMLDYRIRCYRRFPHKEMRQFVIYLHQTGSELVYQNSFRLTKTYHEFEVIRLWEQPTAQFLQLPGLLPLAVLTQGDEPTIILNQVAQAVEEITDNNVKSNVLAASTILAGLILNDTLIKSFFRSDIMKQSVIYQEILKEGETKGKAEGKAEKAQQVAKNLLKEGLSLDLIAKATDLPLSIIESWQKELNQKENN